MDLLIVGHRGNTWRIIKWYLRVGTPVIEVDARYINGDFYALHGPSSIKRASIPGKIMALIDYLFFYRDPILKPVRLRDILHVLNGKADVMIDVKQIGYEEKLVDTIKNTGFRGRIYITSELHPVLKRFKELDRGFITIASINILAVDMARIAMDADADMVSIHLSLINKDLIEEFHRNNIGVLVWTVNDVRTASRLYRMNVDGIVTDRPDLMIRLIGDLRG
jgi:hypothetical protein